MNTLKNIAWAFRHPLFAACWVVTGKPYSVVFGARG